VNPAVRPSGAATIYISSSAVCFYALLELLPRLEHAATLLFIITRCGPEACSTFPLTD